ncbi:unnamed protein product [Meganyctiphanes norvegica]|uniref:Uncharacterized protein n=1 Tax=Meganyctiphanes norvegica TaxID=48144 RepID=A0AAV2R3T6_MEGNR
MKTCIEFTNPIIHTVKYITANYIAKCLAKSHTETGTPFTLMVFIFPGELPNTNNLHLFPLKIILCSAAYFSKTYIFLSLPLLDKCMSYGHIPPDDKKNLL